MDVAGCVSGSHLDRLEAESIQILREVAAEFSNPVMMYSIGKDSSVMPHLLQKAFYPAPPPIPLLHVDTTWKFREMIAFRDRRVRWVLRGASNNLRRPSESWVSVPPSR